MKVTKIVDLEKAATETVEIPVMGYATTFCYEGGVELTETAEVIELIPVVFAEVGLCGTPYVMLHAETMGETDTEVKPCVLEEGKEVELGEGTTAELLYATEGEVVVGVTAETKTAEPLFAKGGDFVAKKDLEGIPELTFK